MINKLKFVLLVLACGGFAVAACGGNPSNCITDDAISAFLAANG